MACKDKISMLIDGKKELYEQASDSIWDYAETRFEEHQSAELLCKILREEGFEVTTGLAGMQTAFVGSFGSGKPVIAILGEFDALFELSQAAGVTEKKPLVPGGSGHGCGHNALGVGALAAAVAVKDYIKKHRLSGTVRYYGCPAEEVGSGKAFMAREGVFDDADAALSWHPGDMNEVWGCSSLAVTQAYFKFSGTSSHAAAAPQLGRSALDAVELMNVGANYLREHVIPEARIHYAITNAGGLSPNVVQANAEVLYVVRAPKFRQAKEIFDRVVKIAKGAALMTGTAFETVIDSGYTDYIPNDTLSRLMSEKMKELGPWQADGEEIGFAKEIGETLTATQKATANARVRDREELGVIRETGIAGFVRPYQKSDTPMPGSTDVGDVSWIVPTAQCSAATQAFGTPGHSWQVVSQGKSGICHKGMLLAAKTIALTAAELFEHPEIVSRAREEWKETLHGESYLCPIPPEVEPAALR
ncbi:M20 family metallopeptidase [Caproicibacter sp.]|uniref:M20 family metallopeptidase n=1 Tax=Caproicibacter sp. TaxID=2814884 RepID=UPI00398A09B0